MRRHNDVFLRSSSGALNRPKAPRLWLLLLFLVLTSLACALLNPNPRSLSRPVIIRSRLPTLTPTPLPALTPVAILPSPNPAVAAAPAQPTPPVLPLVEAPAVAEAGPIPSPTLSQNIEAAGTPVVSAALPAEVVPPASLPTATPVATATAQPPPETATPTATSVPTALPTPTFTPTPPAWSFAGVRVSQADDGSSLLLHGDLINNTGSSQLLELVTATFYDAQGQVIPSANITDYWPTEAVPPGGQVPFELSVAGVSNSADFDLSVEATPSDQTPRQDFEFSDLNQSAEGGDYCLSGILRDQGGEPQEYLVIVVILYDPQNNVVNFGDYYESDPEGEIDEHTLDFQLCVDSLGQNIARHELRAWGL